MKTEAWDWYARNDPLFAVCADPSKKHGKWDIAEFFQSGEMEVSRILAYAEAAGLQINFEGAVLDFGCGVGRLSQAFANSFNRYLGVDISKEMINRALELHRNKNNIGFGVSTLESLQNLSERFTFIYSNLVFQHIDPLQTEEYLKVLVNLLQPDGVLIFQVAEKYISSKHRSPGELLNKTRTILRPKEKLSNIVKPFGISIATGEPGMNMYGISENRIRQVIDLFGGKVIDVRLTNSTQSNFNGDLKFLTQAPMQEWISKQYLVLPQNSPLGHLL